jgi:cellulose synthase/poly-beta-1,6-N-acetylglucosamine synthase-like glycosyltransferase
VAASGAFAVVNGYLALLTVLAALRRRSDHGDARSGPAERGSFRVVVLVPAHNEERSVARTIDSVFAQGHPSELMAVHVVADNCSDATAEVARSHGAHVHERSDTVSPGKGPALGWLVDRLADAGESADAMVILDADTSMEPGFLDAVHAALAGGGSVWQAYYTVREPEASPNTALRHAALALRHYVRPLGRAALGASCGLYGNGMVFRPEILHERQFTAHLTEDVEFQLELVLAGETIGFLPDAVVAAEMPTTLAAAASQNERWELGRLDLVKRYVPRLVRHAVRIGTRRRVTFVDAALDALVPPLSVLGAGTTLMAAAALVPGGSSWAARFRRGLMILSVAALALHVFVGLRVAGVKRSAYVALLRAPRLVVWKVALWIRVMIRPRRVSWARTARNKASEPAGAAGPNSGPRDAG